MVFQIARKLKATVLGMDASDPKAAEELEAAGVPVSEADCRSCADPCDEGHEEFGRRFDVDMETEMRGSVKPYRRQILISTGKTDWAHEVTSVDDSLAKYISAADDRLSTSGSKPKAFSPPSGADPGASKQDKNKSSDIVVPKSKSLSQPVGIHAYKPTGRLSVLNGSHSSHSDDPDAHATVLVLPDYVAVSNVPLSVDGVESFWRHALDPAITRAGTSMTDGELKTWPLPYNCLIMLCSHKKRDARCHIAAQRLESDFTHSLESEGWHVDTDLEDLSSVPPLEAIASTNEAREAAALAQLQTLNSISSAQKKALILKNSHIGGHKFAGNVIIYFPQGASVWYGRVTPHEVASIVKHTILSGKVLPPLLRGGLGIARPGCNSLLDW